jgi:hypothetical protein
MKRIGLLKHLLTAFIIAAGLYLACYKWIEQRRTRKGAWEVRFAIESEIPAIIIDQPGLQISNVRIFFPDRDMVTNFSASMTFAQPRQWPFPVPFGKVVFMDTTFLPGTVTFELFGHEVQLLPRALSIDRKEIPWQSHTNIPISKN